jgi:hypothetical protein
METLQNAATSAKEPIGHQPQFNNGRSVPCYERPLETVTKGKRCAYWLHRWMPISLRSKALWQTSLRLQTKAEMQSPPFSSFPLRTAYQPALFVLSIRCL